MTSAPGRKQFKLVKHTNDDPLPIRLLLLTNFTTMEALKHPNIGGKFELMHRIWTSAPRGSQHPPWDMLELKEPTALKCLPDAETKTVKQFKRMWAFILDRFSGYEGTTKDKFLAADSDPMLKLSSVKAVFDKFCVDKRKRAITPSATAVDSVEAELNAVFESD